MSFGDGNLHEKCEKLEQLSRDLRSELVYAYTVVDEDGDVWLAGDGEELIEKFDARMRECGMEVG